MNNNLDLLLNDDEVVEYPELEFAKLGTVRRCGSKNLVAYDNTVVCALLMSAKRNGTGSRLTLPQAHGLLIDKYDIGGDEGPVFVYFFSSLEEAAKLHPKMLTPDGFSDSFVGVALKKGQPAVGVFSYEKCIEIMMKEIEVSDDDEDPRSIAIEFLEFNTLGSWVGPETSFFLENEEESDTY